MIIAIVFIVVIAAIGLAAYGGSIVHDPIAYIADPEDDGQQGGDPWETPCRCKCHQERSANNLHGGQGTQAIGPSQQLNAGPAMQTHLQGKKR